MVRKEFLVTEATYDLGRQIRYVLRHEITEDGVQGGELVDKNTLVSDIKKGAVYTTAYNGVDSWIKASRIRTFSLRGEPFARIDQNDVEFDYMGDLPVVKGDEGKTPSGTASVPGSFLSKLRTRHLQET